MKPNCKLCAYKRDIPGDCHFRCANEKAKVKGALPGIRNGWFNWPYSFDPIWLVSCDGFEKKK